MKWPRRDELIVYAVLTLALCGLFLLIYDGAAWINAHRGYYHRLYSHWELGIPLMRPMVPAYLSISLLFVVPLLTLTRTQMILLARRMGAAIAIAGLIFVAVPTTLGFDRPQHPDSDGPLYWLIYSFDPPHNLFPSLHVTLASLAVLQMLTEGSSWLRRLLTSWWIMLCASVVLVHQHHLADVLGGLALAWTLHKAVRRRGNAGQRPVTLPDKPTEAACQDRAPGMAAAPPTAADIDANS